MKEYLEGNECRMNFLRSYLGDQIDEPCGKCDVDLNKTYRKTATAEDLEQIESFRESYFPILNVASRTRILVDGVAASFYGVTNVGSMLHHSKYENGGDFPDYLLRLTLKAFRKHYNPRCLILYCMFHQQNQAIW